MNFMIGIYVLTKKEMKQALKSSFLFIVSAIFCFIMGWLFYNNLAMAKEVTTLTITSQVLSPMFNIMHSFFLFLAPLLTMNTFVSEKKGNTLDMLLMSQLSEWQIIISKLFSTFLISFFMISFTFIFPLILSFSGYSDWGMMFTSYTGILLSVMCYLSVGVFCSALTKNQILASLLTFGILMGIMILVMSANLTQNYLLIQMVQYLSLGTHLSGFFQGVFRSYDFIYFLSFLVVFITLTKKKLESRSW
jgi:ABC-2 type transport system permease protein